MKANQLAHLIEYHKGRNPYEIVLVDVDYVLRVTSHPTIYGHTLGTYNAFTRRFSTLFQQTCVGRISSLLYFHQALTPFKAW